MSSFSRFLLSAPSKTEKGFTEGKLQNSSGICCRSYDFKNYLTTAFHVVWDLN